MNKDELLNILKEMGTAGLQKRIAEKYGNIIAEEVQATLGALPDLTDEDRKLFREALDKFAASFFREAAAKAFGL